VGFIQILHSPLPDLSPQTAPYSMNILLSRLYSLDTDNVIFYVKNSIAAKRLEQIMYGLMHDDDDNSETLLAEL
jgi:hypothetical protein